jgi:fructose-bisphosphate aldolase class I
MDKSELTATAQAMIKTGKGLLAMDESNTTCNKRFAKLGIPQTVQAHRDWRELILTRPGWGNSSAGPYYMTRPYARQRRTAPLLSSS